MMQKYMFLIIIIHRTATIVLHFSIDATLVTEKCLSYRYVPVSLDLQTLAKPSPPPPKKNKTKKPTLITCSRHRTLQNIIF